MYCSNCGQQLRDGAKFCDNCGTAVNADKAQSKRKTIYEGKIYKCPNCGEVLDAFVSSCPICGYEIRGAEATDSVKAFANQLNKATTESEKASIIRHFPIPNTKEDIWEFLILVASNVNQRLDEELSAAWQAKLEQVMQKAKLVFRDKSDLSEIEKQHQVIQKAIRTQKNIQYAKKVGFAFAEIIPTLPRLIIVLGWLLSILIMVPMCGVNLDDAGFNGYQLLIMLDFIAGAVFIPLILKCRDVLPKLVAASGLLLSIAVLIPLCGENLDSAGFNSFQLILFVDVISCIVVLVRTIKSNKRISKGSTALNITSLFVTIICVAILFVVYIIGSLSISKNTPSSNHENPTISENMETDDSQGIYTYPIRNYVGKNVASIGKKYGDYLIDEYGNGYLRVVYVSEDGMVFSLDDEAKKQYTVIEQSLHAGNMLTVVHLRDSRGKPYSNLVDYQSYEEIILYIAPIGETGYQPDVADISPVIDRHCYFVRDYIGRNAASFGKYYGDDRVDEYGAGKLRLTFTSEDGSYVDSSREESLKSYIIVSQDIEANSELKIEYEIDSEGKEYDTLIQNQNYEEINLIVKKLDGSVVEQMPELKNGNKAYFDSKNVELTVEYSVLWNGAAEITGFHGDGNQVTIDSKIDGHKVISIGDAAFKNCKTLEEVCIWADVDYVGDYAFYGCSALKEIDLPNETKYIGKHAFEKCTNLTEVILWGDPDIDDYAFAGCSALAEISIGYGTKQIGSHAFDGCTSLSDVLIWNDDTVIGKDAFANCPNLTDRPIQK